MIKILDNDFCYGCTACAFICPTNSINIKSNNGGFDNPVIDKKTCIKCGLCEKVCPVNTIKKNDVAENIYAFINKKKDDRLQSTSGGFFSAISDYILNNNGVIYGASFSDDFTVIHTRATSFEERDRHRGSKYVHSKLYDSFKMVQKDLLDSKMVLFTGTPCQISGLNNYLEYTRTDTHLLYTCDFICHGTASPKIWKNYIKFIKKKYKKTIKDIKFRDKSIGWHHPQLSFIFEGSYLSLDEGHDPFYQLYYSNCIMKDSCYKCQFTTKERCSDITMADCWGIGNTKSYLDDNKGTSLILINNDKGEQIFKKIKYNNICKKIEFNDIIQPHLEHPVTKSKKYDNFWKEYDEKNFINILKKYGNYSLYRKLIKKIKRFILKVIHRG